MYNHYMGLHPESQNQQIRILLVNDIQLISNLVAASLEDEPDITIVDCVSSTEDALRAIDEMEIDVALVSTQLPNQGAIEFTKRIAKTSPSTKVLALGLSEEKKQVMRYIEAGASGFVLKDNSVDELIESIRAAKDKKAYLSPEITSAIMNRLTELVQLLSDCGSTFPDEASLTTREYEILELLGKRMTNQQIADDLIIEVGTVKNHVHSILSKLDVSSRRDASAYLAFVNE